MTGEAVDGAAVIKKVKIALNIEGPYGIPSIDDKYKFRVRRTANHSQSELKRRAPVWIRGTWSAAFHVECTAINS